jgi:ABC-2 type transport system permease protein
LFEWLSSPKWTIARREISSLSREKTIVLAICIQLFIAAFSSFLVVGLTSLYDPGSVENNNQIEVAITGDTEENLIRAANEVETISVISTAESDDALQLFDDNDVDAVLSVNRAPAGGGTQLQVEAIVPAEDLQTTLIVVSLREMLTELETLERQDRVDSLTFTPVDVPEDAGSSGQFGFTYTILLPLLLFLPAFISGSIVVDSVTEEIERDTLELLRVAPLSLVDIVDGKAAGMIAIAPAQAALWMALLRFNGTGVSHVAWLVLFVTAITTLTVGLGTALGLVTGQRRQAQLLYSILVVVLFGTTLALPEHPASTVALLAVDSATTLTFASVAGFTALAVVVYAVLRVYVGRLDPESL